MTADVTPEQMYERWLNGERMVDIARPLGITRERVRQLIARHIEAMPVPEGIVATTARHGRRSRSEAEAAGAHDATRDDEADP